MSNQLAFAVVAVGALLVIGGVAYIYWPASLVAAGGLLMAAGLLAPEPRTPVRGRGGQMRP